MRILDNWRKNFVYIDYTNTVELLRYTYFQDNKQQYLDRMRSVETELLSSENIKPESERCIVTPDMIDEETVK